MKKILFNIQWTYNKCKNILPWIILLIILGSASSAVSVEIALITKSLIDSSTNSDGYNVKKYLIILTFLLLLELTLYCLETIINTLSYEKIRNQIQIIIYNHIMLTRFSDRSKYHSVELLTRMTNDVQTISNNLVTIIPNIFSFLVMFVLSFISLLKISSTMAYLAIILFPMLILIGKIYGRKLKFFYLEIQKKETEFNTFLQECFNNILIVKCFCLERVMKKDLRKLENDRLNLSIRRSRFSCISKVFFSLSSIIGYIFVFIWGSVNLSTNNATANFGNLIAMLQLFSNMEVPISGLASSLPQFVSAFAAVDRLKELAEMPLENNLVLRPFNIKIINTLAKSCANINSLNISFKNVYFEYIYNKPIIENLSFNIDPCETIGIVGSSGEGKTTIIRLILSLLQPTKGEIYINQDKLSSYHRHLVAYVPQGNTLFSGSILSNLILDNTNISHDEIIDVLKMSCAYNFVYELEDNLNTIIGEKGLGLSEGQAQRLTIARALLRKKPILILDEATSSLDPKTEIEILEQIKNLQPKPICIIITHRPSALTICDKVLKLENKNLILMPKSTFYKSLFF